MSVQFENVCKAFGAKQVLDNVSFEAKSGEILFILGKSGVGKSVTLKHTVGLLAPDSGRVLVEGVEVRADHQADNALHLSQIRKRCGMVFQHPALLDSLTIEQNLRLGLHPPLPDEREIRERILSKLDLVHLGSEILDRMPSQISYGMQKRASLARTLVPEPQVLLFDEPTTGLDPVSTQSITRLIRDLSRTLQVTSVVVSHDMGCAVAIADRILVLDHGKVLALGSVAEIRASREPLIVEFLEEMPEAKP